ncbi:FKBP-type peptidyl-prolyl cis-trans isomerase [Aurantibacter crassamenti]|uniref:FKBP-type peptidyl-prolyl cis-trans isomerase n=1 Tax=Aurantibacter crassamenti TaxID=1837375 RepID=UPI00193AC264|nr:FKBP-type peptidyl-prolyl cis-trans isomerase [Aurantibacter crassamenti]MBM1105303.1 FKBP-type peptidyl-prolyl cis-trans isomerase [Aurantibacter crassamenti]
MNKAVYLIIVSLLVSTLGFSQKKKELIAQVAQLKAKALEMQQEVDQMKAEKVVDLTDEFQNFSYAFGVSMGGTLKNLGFDSLSYNSFTSAVEDIMLGQEKMTPEAAQGLIQEAIEKATKAKAAEGELFLSENKKNANIVTTASGLQYEIIKNGDGQIPVATDGVQVHYTGMLIDGKVFDSSVERGEPLSIGVNGVIKGWTEALLLMPVGSKWKLFIPQELGYGARGAGGGEIPPYSTLIFEVELLSID